jgi:hypothetical protein
MIHYGIRKSIGSVEMLENKIGLGNNIAGI